MGYYATSTVNRIKVEPMVCKPCTENLHQCTKGKKSCLKFGIPMVLREPKNGVTDCYI